MYSKLYFFSLLVVFLNLFAACVDSEPETKEPGSEPTIDLSSVAVKVEPVVQRLYMEAVEAIGIVKSQNDALVSSKTGGIIEQTRVKEGDYVKRGQVLVLFNTSEIESQLAQAEEALAKAQRDLLRATNLFADSVATQEQLDNARTGVHVAEKNVEIIQFNLDNSQALAPISGRIVEQLHYAGELVGPGMPVYAIMGTTSQDWIITAGLIDRDWATVQLQDPVTVQFDAFPNQEFTAVIHDKSSIGGDASGTLDVEIMLSKWPQTLAAGMVCHVKIMPQTQSTKLLLPVEAMVKAEGNQATVFTIQQQKAVAQPIVFGKILGSYVEVLSGVEAGDEVVTIGAVYLENGDTVKISNR